MIISLQIDHKLNECHNSSQSTIANKKKAPKSSHSYQQKKHLNLRGLVTSYAMSS